MKTCRRKTIDSSCTYIHTYVTHIDQKQLSLTEEKTNSLIDDEKKPFISKLIGNKWGFSPNTLVLVPPYTNKCLLL